MRTVFSLLILSLLVLAPAAPVTAAPLTLAQRSELNSIKDDLTRAAALIRRKEVTEANELVTKAEERLAKLVMESELDQKDRTVVAVKNLIDLRKKALAAMGAPVAPGQPGLGGVSFSKEVAPILVSRCGNCHIDGNSGQLNIGTFANMKRGGRSGALLVPGNAQGSLLLQRLVANGNARMPKDDDPLPQNEIDLITKWVSEGAKFDGNNETTQLSALSAPANPNPNTPPKTEVKIVYATGDETVSFTKDIAPFMVNLCMNCHSGQNPRSGFSLETFEKLMVGGNSGRVVVPGDLDGSRLWDLVGKQQPLKMPPGQALITRSNWRNLQTWIQEGAKFDGKDPKASLRTLVPTPEQLRMAELAKMTPQEWAQMRTKRAAEIWKRVVRGEEPKMVESKEFIVYGTASQARLQQINNWAEDIAKELKKTFGSEGETIWPGKLIIFVAKDRFMYEEFNFSMLQRQTPKTMFSHAVVKPPFEEAYLVVQDVGDVASTESPGTKSALYTALTEAFFGKGDASKLPTWMLEGSGLAFASEQDRENEYLNALEGSTWEYLQTVKDPKTIFDNGTFSPAGTKAVGYTLAKYLIARGGAPNYGKLITALQSGTSFEEAVKSIYRVDLQTLATSYAKTVPKVRN